MTGSASQKQEVEFTYWGGPARLVAVPEERIGACYGCGEQTVGISKNGNRQCPRCQQEAEGLEAARIACELNRQERREWWLGVGEKLRNAVGTVLVFVITAVMLTLLMAGAVLCLCGLSVQRVWERFWRSPDALYMLVVIVVANWMLWEFRGFFAEWFSMWFGGK